MRKHLFAVTILALVAGLIVAGCGGQEAKPGGVESRAKDIEEKVLEGDSGLKSVAEAYRSHPSTETLTGLVEFANKQEEGLTTLGVDAANLSAAAEETEVEAVNKAVEMVEEAESLMKDLAKAAKASEAALKASQPQASKYLGTIEGVKEAIEAAEKFYEEKSAEIGKE